MTELVIQHDPVCGMPVAADKELHTNFAGVVYGFCSEFCRQQFLAHPDRYVQYDRFDVASDRSTDPKVAYFSMEIALKSELPTYSGGLGVLAGDTLRAAADARLPIIGVTLLHRQGYFRQELDAWGNQAEHPDTWDPAAKLEALDAKVQIVLAGRPVHIAAWRYTIQGATDGRVPVILLDTDLPENQEEDRHITDHLYGGDQYYRLRQEIVLGIGGVRMLRALGFNDIRRYQMNEGHSGLLAAELLREGTPPEGEGWDFDGVRRRCVFTTHTPVPAGHDHFPWDMVEQLLDGQVNFELLRMLGGEHELNMTMLGLNASHYVNGVAKRHAVVSRQMFPDYRIDSVTNGVHAATWACASFADLYDRHIPGWRAEPSSLRYSLGIPADEIWQAHEQARHELVRHVHERTGQSLNETMLTIGFARRATPYKRSTLLFHDLDHLRAIARHLGGLQVIFSGKAHPRDGAGKELIGRIHEAARRLAPDVQVVYLPDYDMDQARLLVSGCDIWLNTPRKPMEASGTSGMKAAINGVPQFSVLDGWWLEGHIEGVTGWCIGTRDAESSDDMAEAHELYRKLERVIGPMYYSDRPGWIDVMRHAMALNGSFFNASRMVQEYALHAYLC
ncbi:alpha-glucan family phosphorylase [Planctomycetales bacterium ZRK34]|nr:alpha-glucan family phosphorylase [Planctomycetales bacterium ZRK34]